MHPGALFKQALNDERPLPLVGTVNAYCALLAEQAGHKALYLSGAGVANASFGLPDLAMTNLTEVSEEVRRITQASSLPLLVDADTGWGSELTIWRTVKSLERAGACGLHLEDQAENKRCGHRPGKVLASCDEMVARIKAAVDARSHQDFIIMARTDAVAGEGLTAALNRCTKYVEAGADMIFPEAITSLEDYARFTSALNVPILANITEFGKTPLFTREQLASVDVRIALYPLTAFRAMSYAAQKAYQTLRTEDNQQNLLNSMQTRDELYATLDYQQFEQKLDSSQLNKDKS